MKKSPGDAKRRDFLAGSAALTLAMLAGCAEKKPYAAVNTPFPEFRLKDIDGAEHDRSHYAGHPLVANFWATWCPPCRAEMPELDQVFRRDAHRGLRVLGFCVDEDPNPVREFRLRVKVSFPLIIDTGHRLARQIGITSFPTTLLVAANGKVSEVLVAPRPWLDYPGIMALQQGSG